MIKSILPASYGEATPLLTKEEIGLYPHAAPALHAKLPSGQNLYLPVGVIVRTDEPGDRFPAYPPIEPWTWAATERGDARQWRRWMGEADTEFAPVALREMPSPPEGGPYVRPRSVLRMLLPDGRWQPLTQGWRDDLLAYGTLGAHLCTLAPPARLVVLHTWLARLREDACTGLRLLESSVACQPGSLETEGAPTIGAMVERIASHWYSPPARTPAAPPAAPPSQDSHDRQGGMTRAKLARPGSGGRTRAAREQPWRHLPTKVVRLPEALVPEILVLARELDRNMEQEGGANAPTSR